MVTVQELIVFANKKRRFRAPYYTAGEEHVLYEASAGSNAEFLYFLEAGIVDALFCGDPYVEPIPFTFEGTEFVRSVGQYLRNLSRSEGDVRSEVSEEAFVCFNELNAFLPLYVSSYCVPKLAAMQKEFDAFSAQVEGAAHDFNYVGSDAMRLDELRLRSLQNGVDAMKLLMEALAGFTKDFNEVFPGADVYYLPLFTKDR